MTVLTYNMEIQEIGHHTRDCDGKRFIIINQTYWYDADKWTDETAAADFMKRYSVAAIHGENQQCRP